MSMWACGSRFCSCQVGSGLEKKSEVKRFENNGTNDLRFILVNYILTVNIIIKVIFTVDLHKLLFYNILMYTY